VAYLLAVHVSNALYNLSEQLTGITLVKVSLLLESAEELSSLTETK